MIKINQKHPVQVQNVAPNIDEEMMLQAIEYALVMGKNLQLLKDQKKILRQENATLKEHIEKLPSTLQLELHSVHEDLMAKMHTVSFKINELIQTYTKFQKETGEIRRSGPLDSAFFKNAGALYATEQAVTYLENCKAFVDVSMNGGVQRTSKKALKKLLKEGVAREPDETAVKELAVVSENNALAHVISARLQQIAEKMNNREKKVSLLKADNSILQKQIERLKSELQSIGGASRIIVEAFSLDPCLNHLHLLQKRIPEVIQRATDTLPTLTKTRDKNEFKGYIERYQVIQTDVSALIIQIQEVAKTITGAKK